MTIETKVETITPQMAQDYLGANVKNRTYNKRHARALAKMIQEGLWVFDANPIKFAENGFLIDGQHRLQACIIAQTPIKSLVVRGLPYEAFHNIDTGRARTAGDILSIEGSPYATTIASSIVKYFALKNGRLAEWGSYRKKERGEDVLRAPSLKDLQITKPEILSFYKDNKTLCDEVGSRAGSLGKGTNGVRIYSYSIIGGYALFLILEKHHPQEYVFDFFNQLITGKNITNESVLTLRNIMVRYNCGQIALTSKQRAAYFAKAWNYYVKGVEKERFRYTKEIDDAIPLL